MIERIKKGKFVLGGFLIAVLAIIIPVTLGQVQQNQENRSRASGEAVAIALEPRTKEIKVGDRIDIAVTLNGGQNNISAVDITFTFDDPLLGRVLIGPSFTPASTFTAVKNEATDGSINFVGVNPTSNAITGNAISVGTIHLRAKAAGTATVGFSKIHVNASGVSGALPIDTANTQNGSYTITTRVDSSSPTQSPTPTETQSSTGNTRINFSLTLEGIGTDSARGLNRNPRNPTRNIDVKFINAQNTVVDSRGTVTFDSATGRFNGGVNDTLTTGAYVVKVRMSNTLWKQIPGVHNIIRGATRDLPPTKLVTGDLNGDNTIDLVDYTLMMACYAKDNVCE